MMALNMGNGLALMHTITVFQVVAILFVSCVTLSQVQAGFFDTSLMEMERRPQEEYDAFFKLIDNFLWDSEVTDDVAEERQYYGQYQYGAPLRRRGKSKCS